MRTQGEPCLFSFTPKVNSQGCRGRMSCCQRSGFHLPAVAILIGSEICNRGNVFPMISIEQVKTDCKSMP